MDQNSAYQISRIFPPVVVLNHGCLINMLINIGGVIKNTDIQEIPPKDSQVIDLGFSFGVGIFKQGVLKLYSASELSGRLVEVKIAMPHNRVYELVDLEQDLRMCVFSKFSGAIGAVDLGTRP